MKISKMSNYSLRLKGAIKKFGGSIEWTFAKIRRSKGGFCWTKFRGHVKIKEF